MAELALGVVGIVPVLGLVFKSHKALYKKLKAYKEYSAEAKSARDGLKVQKALLENEWKLIWNLAVKTESERVMLKPSSDDAANEKADRLLRLKLGNNYDVCLSIMQAVQGILEGLEDELGRVLQVDESPEALSNRKPLRKLRRIQDGLKVALNRDKWVSTIKKLKDARSDLSILGCQLKRLDQRKNEDLPSRSRPRAKQVLDMAGWRASIKVRRSSMALHDALVETWNCCQDGHQQHLFKLFLETGQRQDDIYLKLAILYNSQRHMGSQSTMAQLEVRSQMIELGFDQPSPALTPSNEDAADQGPSKRLKIVRFSETTFKTSSGAHLPTTPPPMRSDCGSSMCDLRSTRDVCLKLTHHSPGPLTWTGYGPPYLGHLDIAQQNEKMRFSFFSKCLQPPDIRHDPLSLQAIIATSNVNLVSPIDKLKLARTIALATIEFHSTPWLSDVWQIHELSMYVDDIEDLSRSMWSLHLGREFPQNCGKQLESMEGVSSAAANYLTPESMDDEEIRCNIKSRPLYSLGVALLQIDQWTSLDVSDVVKVRRTAERPSLISTRYKDLTEKCLECDFGRKCGKDLSKVSLQQAVYKNVVGELDDLIHLVNEMNTIDSSDDE